MKVVLIPGDGIGPEVAAAAREVVAATGVTIDWVIAPAGAAAAERFGDPLPAATLALVREHRVALKGPCTTPIGKGYRSINVRMRQALDLFASTRAAAERIVRFAFELARREGRRRVTFCHKVDVLRLSDGLFLDSARTVAEEFPFLEFEERRIDNLCMELALDPSRFDVLVMENLFGDVISDLCAGLVGGISATVGINHGAGVRVYESIHGEPREVVGEDRGNPLPIIFAAAALLEDQGEAAAAVRIRAAAERVLTEGRVRTPDLGGRAGTVEMATAIAAAMR